MLFRITLLLVALISLNAAFGADMTLAAAKNQGTIGEMADGYLAAVQDNASADVQALIRDINTKRRAEYQRIAKANNITLADVEALAGRKAIQRTSPGNYVRMTDGSWRRK